jgi:adenosylhomocysteine nucleosidase
MTIGVMGAMPEEVDALVDRLEGASRVERGRRVFHSGVLWGQRCVVVFSRCGKVAAAATAAELITVHRVGEIVVMGVAGRVDETLHMGDVVVADALVQHDLDASPIFPAYEVPYLGLSRFKTDARRRSSAVGAARRFLAEDLRSSIEPDILSELKIDRPRVVEGLILSGDRFIASDDAVADLRRRFPDAACVDMESAAVAQVCYAHDTPCTVIRMISDSADDNACEHFACSLSRLAGAYAGGIMRRLLGDGLM